MRAKRMEHVRPKPRAAEATLVRRVLEGAQRLGRSNELVVRTMGGRLVAMLRLLEAQVAPTTRQQRPPGRRRPPKRGGT